MTDNYILDTNIIIDFQSAEILRYLNCDLFFVSNVVYTEEISKQIKSDSYYQLNLINEYLEKKEKEILEKQKELIVAKTENLKSGQKLEGLYIEAMEAMRRYSGIGGDDNGAD